MTLTNPLFLLVGAVVALLLVLGQWRHGRRRRVLAEALGGPRAGARLSRGGNLYRPPFERMALLTLGALAVGTAAAEPRRVGTEPEPPPAPEIHSLVLVIDVSASMQGTDVAPNRLGAAVRQAGAIMAEIPLDRIGLVLVAGEAYPLAPPTRDHGVLRFLLGGVVPTVASAHDPGSLLSNGLESAASLLQAEGEPEGRRTIVLLSDGEAGESDAALEATLAGIAEAGITVHTIGFGTPEGSGMTMPAAPFQLGGRILTEDGTPAVSRLRESTLYGIAAAGGGLHARADDATAMREIERRLGSPPPAVPDTSEEPEPFVATLDPVVLLAALALGLLLAESSLDVRGRGLGGARKPSGGRGDA